ncbi:13599_t:CDS:2 [Ambispora leptoticha]|uniref:Protein-serine/threonine kinase n=1 Tax=Ambispora leptoticha TaxID=144679 RepID=A0A9N9CUU6_9GLOM|nr:13599_t:CDS:2 [Ambispora leptoticha]
MPISRFRFISLSFKAPRLTFTNTSFNILKRDYTTQDVISFYDDKVTKSARYTRSELPVRLARRVKALQNLPFIVGTNPYIKSVYRLYFNSFEAIRGFPEITSIEKDAEFAALLKETVDLHAVNIPTLAKGFQECRKYMNSEDIKFFLDDMIRARIGIRLIAEQHIALYNALHNDHDPNFIGIINTRMRPEKLIEQCAKFVHELCELHYGSAPETIIDGQIDTTFMYVPVHLEYIITEILKNSHRATVEYSQKINRYDLPPIQVTISQGKNNIGIRVRDQGGGVSAKDLPSIFDYSFTTVPRDEHEDHPTNNILAGVSTMAMQAGLGGPIAGLGYGLPLARNYAEYFGGSMHLMSLHSHGCDVFLYLKQIDESLDLQI